MRASQAHRLDSPAAVPNAVRSAAFHLDTRLPKPWLLAGRTVSRLRGRVMQGISLRSYGLWPWFFIMRGLVGQLVCVLLFSARGSRVERWGVSRHAPSQSFWMTHYFSNSASSCFSIVTSPSPVRSAGLPPNSRPVSPPMNCVPFQ
jgi:hypothetical protein